MYSWGTHGSMNVVKLLTEGLEDMVGATFAVEADPQKASRILIRHIEKKRQTLGLDSREIWFYFYEPITPGYFFPAAGLSTAENTFRTLFDCNL